MTLKGPFQEVVIMHLSLLLLRIWKGGEGVKQVEVQILVLPKYELLCDSLSAKVASTFHANGVCKMSTSFCLGLTDRLESHSWRVNDSHPFNTTETR